MGLLPAGFPSGLDPLIGGIAADPGADTLVHVRGPFRVRSNRKAASTACPLSAGACATWNSPTNLTADANGLGDLILEETLGGPATRLYVTHAGKVTCLRLSDGQPCSSVWINVVANPVIRGVSVAPVLNSAGQMSQVCLSNAANAAPACFDAQTAVQGASPIAFAASTLPYQSMRGVSAFRIPGTTRVLYPYGMSSNAATPLCS